jgi:hypothetical protein
MCRKVESNINNTIITKAIEVNAADWQGQLHKGVQLFASKNTCHYHYALKLFMSRQPGINRSPFYIGNSSKSGKSLEVSSRKR